MRRCVDLGGSSCADRWWVLVGGMVVFVAAGLFGRGAVGDLSSGGFNEPGRGVQPCRRHSAGDASLRVHRTFSYWSPRPREGVRFAGGRSGRAADATASIRPGDRRGVLVLEPRDRSLSCAARTSDEPSSSATSRVTRTRCANGSKDFAERYTVKEGPVTVGVGGAAEVFRAVSDQAEQDLRKAELISTPVTVILLLIVFGSVVAAMLPLPVAGLAVVGTLVVLRLFAMVTDVSVFALNLTTAMGLGLAIDYSLFMVSRYREELGTGRAPEAALLRTMQTAGRTVALLRSRPSPCRWLHSWCSPWRTSGPLHTREQASSPSPGLAPSSSCRRCWPCWDRGSKEGRSAAANRSRWAAASGAGSPER